MGAGIKLKANEIEERLAALEPELYKAARKFSELEGIARGLAAIHSEYSVWVLGYINRIGTQRSPARAAASRANGKRGGRKGGRPRTEPPEE